MHYECTYIGTIRTRCVQKISRHINKIFECFMTEDKLFIQNKDRIEPNETPEVALMLSEKESFNKTLRSVTKIRLYLLGKIGLKSMIYRTFY